LCAIGRALALDGVGAPSTAQRWPLAAVCPVSSTAVPRNDSGVPVWCNWMYVHCDATSKSVVSFDNQGNGGSFPKSRIPPEFGALLNLKRIRLDSAHLNGTIPTSLGRLSQLNYLSLTYNSLTGTIPALNMPAATKQSGSYLDLYYNQLAGPVPAFVANLAYKYLDQQQHSWRLSGNCFLYSDVASIQGTLTDQGHCPPVTPSTIAAEGQALCQIARAWTTAGLKFQRFDSVSWSYVSAALFYSTSWDQGDWRLGYSARNSTCAYDTSLPPYQPDWCRSWNGVSCGSNYAITSLYVNARSWTKTSRIPTAIGALTNLQSLTLNQMGLTGSIPTFAGLSRLTQLDVSNNMLTGTVPAFVNTTYSNSWNLNTNCNVTSNIPKIANRIYDQGKCKGDKGEPGAVAIAFVCFAVCLITFSFLYSPGQ
jgi:hypothetical protein